MYSASIPITINNLIYGETIFVGSLTIFSQTLNNIDWVNKTYNGLLVQPKHLFLTETESCILRKKVISIYWYGNLY
jgi:hypothetical protein